jgi:GTPase
MQFCRALMVKEGAQASKIVGADRNEVLLRSGDRARVTFEFLYRPEYLVLGARLIFREGGTKGIGKASLPGPDGLCSCRDA